MSLNTLIVDDEPGLRKGLAKILSLQDHQVHEASGANQARKIIREKDVDLVLLDLKLGQEDGFQLLRELGREEPLIPVIIITGFGNIKNAVECLKAGAINYITKPIDKDLLLSVINKELESSRLRRENMGLREILAECSRITPLKSRHPRMKEIDFIIRRIKDSPATVLILGESGTGKEVTARQIHHSGIHGDRPFIGVNCASLNDNLLESELFGHERGAFTGAVSRRLGRFELAGEGTLFLDEVGDMSLAMQAKLLRVLQERSFERVGGTKAIRARCRIIAASNKDLQGLLARGAFREDLYYRLSLIVIELPPLRQRREDIESLSKLFIQQANREYNRKVKGVSPPVLRQIEDYPWPGNIRQLQNVITNAVILSQDDRLQRIDLLEAQALAPSSGSAGPGSRLGRSLDYRQGLKPTVSRIQEQVERELIAQGLRANQGNISQTARALGITRKTLYEKMQRYAL